MRSFGKVAVVSGEGMGDSMIMMIAAHQFVLQGFEVDFFTNHLHSFGPWLDQVCFRQLFDKEFTEESLWGFDTIIMHHENTLRAQSIHRLREKGKTVYAFYNNYHPNKHPPLDAEFDFSFSQQKTMAQCVAEATAKILDLPYPSMEIGMKIPEELVFRKNKRKVLLHPTSANPLKNWSKKKFIRLAKKLRKEGFQPTFIVSPKERKDWLFVLDLGFDVPLLPRLSDLAGLTYEAGFFIGNDSGPGHLASYLQIPNLILAQRKNSIFHWRPGWLQGPLLLPPKWTPNIKGLRLRENKWQFFVPVSKVLKTFQEYRDQLN